MLLLTLLVNACVIESPLAQVHFIECVASLYRSVVRSIVDVGDAVKALS